MIEKLLDAARDLLGERVTPDERLSHEGGTFLVMSDLGVTAGASLTARAE